MKILALDLHELGDVIADAFSDDGDLDQAHARELLLAWCGTTTDEDPDGTVAPVPDADHRADEPDLDQGLVEPEVAESAPAQAAARTAGQMWLEEYERHVGPLDEERKQQLLALPEEHLIELGREINKRPYSDFGGDHQTRWVRYLELALADRNTGDQADGDADQSEPATITGSLFSSTTKGWRPYGSQVTRVPVGDGEPLEHKGQMGRVYALQDRPGTYAWVAEAAEAAVAA